MPNIAPLIAPVVTTQQIAGQIVTSAPPKPTALNQIVPVNQTLKLDIPPAATSATLIVNDFPVAEKVAPDGTAKLS